MVMTRLRVDYGLWVLRLLGWDGLLPALIVLIPCTLKLLLPRNLDDVVLTAAIIPPVALFIRGYVGIRQINSNHCSHLIRQLQGCVLLLAITPLMIVDVFLILYHALPKNGPNRWASFAFGGAIAGYLVLMAFAMYPGGTKVVTADSEDDSPGDF